MRSWEISLRFGSGVVHHSSLNATVVSAAISKAKREYRQGHPDDKSGLDFADARLVNDKQTAVPRS